MPQVVQCPQCAKKLKAPDEFAGRRVACPACQAVVSIPPAAAKPNSGSNVAAPPAPPVAKKSPPRAAPSSAASTAPNSTAQAATITVECRNCLKKLKAPAQLVGKTVNCPACKKPLTIRRPAERTAAVSTLPPRVTPPHVAAASSAALARTAPPGSAAGAATSPIKAAAIDSAAAGAHRVRPRFMYLLFVLTMLPLVLNTLGGESNVEERLARTLASHPEIEAKAESIESEVEFFALLPGGRIEGAHLSHFSRVHWLYALIAAAAFFFVVKLLFEPGKSTAVQMITIAAVTSTVGIISLIMFQFIADWTQGYWMTGRSIVVILFYIVKFIGFSYSAASDPENGFLLSFLGYTCGVGLCEELTKIVPVLFVLGEQKKADWRAACVLGLASGVGFGVAEGILYSGQYYNGVMSLDVYLVRFISCVALHATWTAAVAVLASQNMSGFDTNEGTDYFVHLLLIMSVPMILHGLYDTLLKRDMGGLALVVAVGSFAWLVFCIERARSNDPQPARRRLVTATA